MKHLANKSSYKMPKHLPGSFNDSALWARSTLTPGEDMKLVRIYELKPGNYASAETIRHRMWLHDILDDNGIPYHLVIRGYWPARRRFAESQCIFVEDKYSKKARLLINEFQNLNNVITEDINGKTMVDDIENGLPLIKCSSCGRIIEFDYYKCPYCKAVCLKTD